MSAEKKTCLVLALLLFSCSTAGAQQRALLLMGNLQQQLNFEYTYDNRKIDIEGGRESSSTKHKFEESYRLDMDYVVYKPGILNGHLAIEGELDQERFSHSGSSGSEGFNSGENLRYTLGGTLFQWQPVTVNFHSKKEQNHIAREFSETYDENIDAHGVNLIAKNDFLPFHLEYSYVDISTDGLFRDFTRSSETYSAGVDHRLGNLSRTSFQYQNNRSRFELEGNPEEDRLEGNNISVRNALTWESERKARSLTSSLTLRSDDGTVNGEAREDRFFSWFESLQWQLGRALDAGLDYSLTDQESTLYDLRSQNGRAFLRHRFVQSLTSEIEAEAHEDEVPAGKEEEISGALHLIYEKNLPRNSRLLMQFSKRLAEVDREFSSSAPVTEVRVVEQFGQFLLGNPGVELESIEVRNADPTIRITPYIRGEDYIVEQIGFSTLIIVFPERIPVGTTLSIFYRFEAAEDARYRESSTLLAGSLMLNDNALRIYGSWNETDQKLVSGTEASFRLNDSRQIIAGFESIQSRRAFGLEYKNVEFTYDKYQSFFGFYRSSLYLGRGIATFGINDTFTMVEGLDAGDEDLPDRQQNSLGLNASYLSSLFGRGRLRLSGDYVNSRGDFIKRDDITCGADYQMSYGKFLLSLQSKLTWRMTDRDTTREDFFLLRLTRYL